MIKTCYAGKVKFVSWNQMESRKTKLKSEELKMEKHYAWYWINYCIQKESIMRFVMKC